MTNRDLLFGIEEAKKGNYEKAAEHLAKAVQSDPMNTDGWLFLGHCLSDIEKKKYCYQRVLTIDPQNGIAKISLAKLNKLETPVRKISVPDFSDKNSVSIPDTEAPAKTEKPEQNGIFRIFVFGFILALLICALPGTLLVTSGQLDNLIMEKYFSPNLFTLEESATPPPLQNQDRIDAYFAKASQAMSDKDYREAISYFDQVIELSPKNYTAYAKRAKCYYRLNSKENSLDAYNANLQSALSDINMAISLQPEEAEYYSLRRDVLADTSSLLSSQADREILLKSAIDNERKFISLSPLLERRLLMSTALASDLIDAGQCTEGMQIVSQLEKKILPGDGDKYGCLQCVAASGYACLGDMDNAVKSMDKVFSTSNDPKNSNISKSRVYLKALYLYQAGRKEETLDILNTSLSADPTFVGDRYYLRALVALDMGDKERALQDLSMGEMYTWQRADLYAYVQAKLALEAGDIEGAINWLQVAEASYYPHSSVLQKQTEAELLQLDSLPLEVQHGIDFQVTPMPPVTPIP